MAKTVGVFGGSGLYQLDGITDLKEVEANTPFGPPSAKPKVGYYGETKVVFIPRHGDHHTILPSEINYKANIFAMKQLGVEWCLSVSAVGSLKEEIKPGEMVAIDQFIDRTKDRPSTFFGDGITGHVAFGSPICQHMQKTIVSACETVGAKCHVGGTYICMEGPQFSTRAESNLYRSWGASVIGMTNLPEAKLAREAGMCYGTLAMATDYDCWYEQEEVDQADIIRVLTENAETSQKVFIALLDQLPDIDCEHRKSLETAIITDPAKVPAELKKRMAVIFGDYI